MNNKLNLKQISTAAILAAGASVVINSVLFFIFKAVGVITDDVFIQPNEPLTIVPVLISSILPTIIGAFIFFLFEKYTHNGFKIFSVLAIILMILSLASPFMAVQGMPVGYGLVLDIMHLIVALSLLYFIKKAKQ